jgi:hypothetical protein
MTHEANKLSIVILGQRNNHKPLTVNSTFQSPSLKLAFLSVLFLSPQICNDLLTSNCHVSSPLSVSYRTKKMEDSEQLICINSRCSSNIGACTGRGVFLLRYKTQSFEDDNEWQRRCGTALGVFLVQALSSWLEKDQEGE